MSLSLPNQNRDIMFVMYPPPAPLRFTAKARTQTPRLARLTNFMRLRFSLAALALAALGSGWVERADTPYFAPTNRLTAIGVDRQDMSQLLLEERIRLMIESQTFVILRDPEALAGA